MALILDVDVGETVRAGLVVFRIERKSGTRVRVSIEAPAEVRIQHERAAQERRPTQAPAHECHAGLRAHHGKYPVQQGP